MTDKTASISGDAPVATATVPRAGIAQAIILIAAACMPILGSTSIAPLQPAMIAAFPGQPGAGVLVAMVLTVPALVIGLTAFGIGRVIDAIGRKLVLVAALFAYAAFGTMPLYLQSLPLILASRVFVGVAEAAIYAGVVAILADYFAGGRRARYYGIQNMVTGLGAVVFIALAGILGGGNWRIPFWMYSVAVLLAILAWVFLPAVNRPNAKRAPLPPVNWGLLAKPVLITLIGGIVFYVPVGLLALKLAAVGVTQTPIIGAVSAIAAVATAVGAGTYSAILKRRPNLLLVLAFGLLGIGLLGIGIGDALPVVAIGAIVANLGGGFLIPTLQNWAVQSVPYEQRGRASGWWTSSFFVGQFIGPVVIVGVSSAIGLSWPIAVVGVVALVMAIVVRVVVRLRPNDELAV